MCVEREKIWHGDVTWNDAITSNEIRFYEVLSKLIRQSQLPIGHNETKTSPSLSIQFGLV